MWLVASLVGDRRRDQDHLRKLHEMVLKRDEHFRELLDADFVLRALQRGGIAPYLPLASERMAKDVESICQAYGLTQEQAIQWITNQFVETKTDGE